jgi:hypothetical protein
MKTWRSKDRAETTGRRSALPAAQRPRWFFGKGMDAYFREQLSEHSTDIIRDFPNQEP